MRLIDADELKARYDMGDDCDNCKTNWMSCHYDRRYSKMYFCMMIDDTPTIELKTYEDIIKDVADASFTGGDGLDYVETLVVLNALKKYKPEQKMGKWIYDAEVYPGGNPCGHYDCDQCGESVLHRSNFCPNCGIQMEE